MSTEENKEKAKVSPVSLVQMIQNTNPAQIGDLDIVKKRFVQNYNLCHGNNMGEIQYNRQQIFFKQAIQASTELQNADRFSLYAAFATLAVKSWSLDPQDDECYLLAMGGKAVLWPQAGAHVRRLISTGQILRANQVNLVYRGDNFKVKMGRVAEHDRNFQSDEIIAAYVIFEIDEKGNQKHFIYEKSDWESWKKKSKQGNGANWKQGQFEQPEPGFLRTKVLKHACKEKGWAIGSTPPGVEQFENAVVIEDDLDDTGANNQSSATPPVSTPNTPPPPPNTTPPPGEGVKPQHDNTNNISDAELVDDESFAEVTQKPSVSLGDLSGDLSDADF